MSDALTVSADLTDKIIKTHRAAQVMAEEAVCQAIACGNLLLQAKAETKHGDFGAYCKSLPFGDRMAQRYMQAATWAKSNPTRVSEIASLRGLLTMTTPASTARVSKSAPKLATTQQQKFADLARDDSLDKAARAEVLEGVFNEKALTPLDAYHAALMAVSVVQRVAPTLKAPQRAELLDKFRDALGVPLITIQHVTPEQMSARVAKARQGATV